MRRFAFVSVLVGGVLLVGCNSQPKDASGFMTEQEREAHQAPFDSHEEPKITAETHFAAGQLAEAQGKADVAIAQYQAALQIDGRHTASLYRMGIVMAQQRRFKEAAGVWEQYVKATGESATAYANLGFCQELAGAKAEAETAYRKGIARDPKNVACRVNYGLMLARNGRVNEGMIQLQAVLPPGEVHYNLGSLYEQMGQKTQAKVEYRKALEADPNLGDAQSRLAALD